MQEGDIRRNRAARIYTAAEKKVLVGKLLDAKDKVTWTAIYKNAVAPGTIPSRRTVYRIFNDPDGFRIRDITAQQIENLLLMLQNNEADLATRAAQKRDAYSALRPLCGVSRDANRAFLDAYEGTYRCIRLTTRSREILVTHLVIRAAAGDIPRFTHVELIPDEAQQIPSRNKLRMIKHDGYVLPIGRRATFVSFEGGVRQMSCISSTNSDQPGFSGVLLSTDAIGDFPFAARVILEHYREISESELESSNDHGLFPSTDPRFSPYLDYIRNSSKRLSVLFAEKEI